MRGNLAAVGEANAPVSGDADRLALAGRVDYRIMTPAAFLQTLLAPAELSA